MILQCSDSFLTPHWLSHSTDILELSLSLSYLPHLGMEVLKWNLKWLIQWHHLHMPQPRLHRTQSFTKSQTWEYPISIRFGYCSYSFWISTICFYSALVEEEIWWIQSELYFCWCLTGKSWFVSTPTLSGSVQSAFSVLQLLSQDLSTVDYIHLIKNNEPQLLSHLNLIAVLLLPDLCDMLFEI